MSMKEYYEKKSRKYVEKHKGQLEFAKNHHLGVKLMGMIGCVLVFISFFMPFVKDSGDAVSLLELFGMEHFYGEGFVGTILVCLVISLILACIFIGIENKIGNASFLIISFLLMWCPIFKLFDYGLNISEAFFTVGVLVFVIGWVGAVLSSNMLWMLKKSKEFQTTV